VTEGAREQGRGVGRMSVRGAAWLAWSLWALCVALAVVTALLGFRSLELGLFAAWFGVAMLVYATVGALVISRRPKNAVGYILLGLGTIFEIQAFAGAYTNYAQFAHPNLPMARTLGDWITPWSIGPWVLLGVVLLVLLFPNGKLPHRMWRVVAWMAVCGTALVSLWWWTWPEDVPVLYRIVETLGNIGQAALTISCVASVFAVVGRMQGAEGEQRQQLKWFAYGAALLVGAFLFLTFAANEQTNVWVIFAVIVLGLSAVPVTVGVAVLRYRLYDIDVLINRTLVYGALSVILVVAYVVAIVLSQGVFRALTGQRSQLAVVASTLAIAALFSPLRRRVQAFVDRRFYRSKYDARKTLEAFSAKLRDETDLDALSDDMLGVVRETMQPAHVGLWLRSDAAAGREESAVRTGEPSP
jgi:hypothetical protein